MVTILKWASLLKRDLRVGTLISLVAEEAGINVEGCKSFKINKRGGWDFSGKKIVHNCNKRGVEGGKNVRNNGPFILQPLF